MKDHPDLLKEVYEGLLKAQPAKNQMVRIERKLHYILLGMFEFALFKELGYNEFLQIKKISKRLEAGDL